VEQHCKLMPLLWPVVPWLWPVVPCWGLSSHTVGRPVEPTRAACRAILLGLLCVDQFTLTFDCHGWWLACEYCTLRVCVHDIECPEWRPYDCCVAYCTPLFACESSKVLPLLGTLQTTSAHQSCHCLGHRWLPPQPLCGAPSKECLPVSTSWRRDSTVRP
jgi:hypothetical protein